jgi:hypothetical protein
MRHPSRSDKLKTFLEEDWSFLWNDRKSFIEKDLRFAVSY